MKYIFEVPGLKYFWNQYRSMLIIKCIPCFQDRWMKKALMYDKGVMREQLH